MIRCIAEHYGFTPYEIGQMTIYQVAVLVEEEEKVGNSDKQTMSVAEYRRLVKRGKL